MSKNQSEKVVVPLLTTSKRKTETPKLKINGLEKQVTRLRARQQRIDNLEKQQTKEETVLLNVVSKERIKAEEGNQFFKTCAVASAEENRPVDVTFANRFSKINIENEEALKECLGELFNELYACKIVTRIKDDISVEMLKSKIGEEMYTLLFTEEKYIAHANDYMECRAKLRTKLDEKTNKILDQLAMQTQSKASIKYK